jgi:dipeptidyl aminopeptidase/acylaminoacyl peptidase
MLPLFSLCARLLPGLAIGAALAGPAFAAGAAAAADTAPMPIDAFFSNPLLEDATLSPSGRYLAAISAAPGRRDALVVLDLQDNKPRMVAGFKDADILDFEWVSDQRLLFNVSDKQTGPGGQVLSSGLYAVDRDGSAMRQLAHRRGPHEAQTPGTNINRRILSWNTFMLRQRGAQDSDRAYVVTPEFNELGEVRTVGLLQLDTRTGQTWPVKRPGTIDGWLLDNAGEPRLATHSKDGKTTIYYREKDGETWRTIAQFATYAGSKDAFTPVGFGADGTLFVLAQAGQDTASLHTYDLASGKLSPEPIVVTRGYDFTGGLVTRRGKVLGVSIETDARANVWFDKEMQAVQEAVDKQLPSTVNTISVPSQLDAQWVLVRSYSDTRPVTYRAYNAKTGAFVLVGKSRDGIDPARMGRQDPVRYKARDGREIPALLTLPAGGAKKNLPLVMLVHGGPYLRGNHWGWNPPPQFLASRGYAVLEPDFRGSRGYGQAHYRAGWKQWGLAMQDDIADGARWAIAQGYADPQRICIAGGSYGGYAALMGLVKDPDLYKCAVNYFGVTDINLLYDGHWSFKSDLQDDWRIHGMPLLVGDQVKDAAQLKATSPIEQAARITQPVLLAYGASDRRVPLYHGKKFRDAVASHNKEVEWVVYPEEGHGWSQLSTRVDFWGRVEKFLDKHIGSGAAR